MIWTSEFSRRIFGGENSAADLASRRLSADFRKQIWLLSESSVSLQDMKYNYEADMVGSTRRWLG